MSLNAQSMDRRTFLKTSATGTAGLLIGFYFHGEAELLAAEADLPVVLNAWIHVGSDDLVTILIDKSEMGQSILTGLAMIAADELDCDWKKVRTECAPADKVYINPRFGVQGTGGSSGTPTSWDPLRKASATARAMLLEAAAQKWGVDASQCRAENSTILHAPTKRSLTYGSLAEAASKLPVPQNVPLKTPSQYTLIGKATKRLDTPDKVNGSAQYGIDVRLPGMLYAVVARCPVFGGKVASFDAAKAKAIPGVKDVIQISNGVAVIADNTWTAMQGRRALEIKWDEGPNAMQSSAAISRMFAELVTQPNGAAARKDGDAEAVLAKASKKIEAVYEVPYLSHAPMEPMNCTAHVRADGCDVWAPTQMQTPSRDIAAQVSGLKPEQVKIHSQFMGGGFGRRGSVDYVGEVGEIAQKIGMPVKLTWSREDDMQHDLYRPAAYVKFTGSLNASGIPEAWSMKVATPPFGFVRNGIAGTAVAGLVDLEYKVPN